MKNYIIFACTGALVSCITMTASAQEAAGTPAPVVTAGQQVAGDSSTPAKPASEPETATASATAPAEDTEKSPKATEEETTKEAKPTSDPQNEDETKSKESHKPAEEERKPLTENERTLWALGGGVRLNFLGLSGGFSGQRYSDGASGEVKYRDIGMNTISPSLALAMGFRYKLFNLSASASRGVYEGSFVTQNDIIREDINIPAGTHVDGKMSMGIYSLATTISLLRRKHDLGLGLGFLFLNMGTHWKTEDDDFGGDHFYPMPFLALSGRLNFGRLHFSGSGGGAYFNGKKDDLDYKMWYYTLDVRAAYDVTKGENWSSAVAVGFRSMVMDGKGENEEGWLREQDFYRGAFLSYRVKFTRFVGD